MFTENLDKYLPLIQENALIYGLNFIKAILIFIVGKIIVKLLTKGLKRAIKRAGSDAMLANFIGNIAYGLMLIFVVISAIGQLGVQTASLIAIMGAAGLAIGLALQGSLSNFAAGVMLIIFRPFNVGDIVEVAGKTGQIENLDIFTTTLRLPDQTKIIVPNGQALDGTISNFTEAGQRRLELAVGISYDADIANAKDVILNAVKKADYVLDQPVTRVGVTGLGDNSVDLVVRPWVKSADYGTASLELLELIKVALDEAEIAIPYPQRDVHHFQHTV